VEVNPVFGKYYVFSSKCPFFIKKEINVQLKQERRSKVGRGV
jgi:hypothetical protein